MPEIEEAQALLNLSAHGGEGPAAANDGSIGS
jgi:hypothetical protein